MPDATTRLNAALEGRYAIERFLAEIKTTANLQHPHILPLFDSGEADGIVFYVMPGGSGGGSGLSGRVRGIHTSLAGRYRHA